MNFFLLDINIAISIRTFPNDGNEPNLCEGPVNGIESISYCLIETRSPAFVDREGQGTE